MQNIISPIFYMGNKKKLIKKGLVDLFPANINTFVDLFGGSGIVSLNVKANNYIINDLDKNIYSLYDFFRINKYEDIVNYVEKTIDEFGLPKIRTKRNNFFDTDAIARYKEAYIKLRNRYNAEKNIFDFYTLMFFSFSQQFRFNQKGGFNMPFGNDCFTDKNKEYIRNGVEFFSKDSVEIISIDFKQFDLSTLAQDDFIYLDAPYINTTAVYNENGGWQEADENKLFELLENLISRDIKFAFSNVYHNKGIENTRLINFVEDNKLNAFGFDKFTYCACGKGNAETQEVLITNYAK